MAMAILDVRSVMVVGNLLKNVMNAMERVRLEKVVISVMGKVK